MAWQYWSKKKQGFSFLLDEVPGASLAYSVRKLRSSYTGNCIEMGVSGSGNISQIGFLDNGIDRSQIQSHFTTFGNYGITRLYDQSGNGRNGVSDGFNQATINKLDDLGFNISAPVNTLCFRMPFDIGFLISPNFQAVTVFMVFQQLSVTGEIVNRFFQGSTANDSLFLSGTFSGIGGFGIAQGGAVRVQATTENTLRHLGVYLGGSLKEIYIDNVLEGDVANTYTDPTFVRIGSGSLGPNTRLQEVIVYPDLKNSERVTIQNNINAYYSIY